MPEMMAAVCYVNVAQSARSRMLSVPSMHMHLCRLYVQRMMWGQQHHMPAECLLQDTVTHSVSSYCSIQPGTYVQTTCCTGIVESAEMSHKTS